MMHALKHHLHLLRYSWRALGPRTMLRHSLRYLLDGEARNSNCDFDARFGTDTTAAVTPREAALPAERCESATMYLPTVDEDLGAMLGALAWPEALAREATFVDIGSGKGRVVLLAAMQGFREVVGVELSPVLHAIAERNVELVRASGALQAPVKLTNGDATEFDVPSGSLVVYLYHPFGEPIAEVVIDRIVASLASAPRPAAILYGHPTLQRPLEAAVFTRGGMFSEHARGSRRTQHYQIGWSVFTNQAWLAANRCLVA